MQKGIQRFKCTKCGKKIYHESKTTPVWYNSKYKPHGWKQFLVYEMQHLPLRESLSLLGISLNTLFTWRHKIFSSLDKYYASFNYFRGCVQIDGAYFPFSNKGNKNACRNLGKGYNTYYESDYKIYSRVSKDLHRGGKDSSVRGLIGEKVCYSTALTMSNFSATSRATNFGKPSSNDIEGAFGNIISNDGKKSTNNFAKENEIPIIQIKNGMKHSEI